MVVVVVVVVVMGQVRGRPLLLTATARRRKVGAAPLGIGEFGGQRGEAPFATRSAIRGRERR